MVISQMYVIRIKQNASKVWILKFEDQKNVIKFFELTTVYAYRVNIVTKFLLFINDFILNGFLLPFLMHERKFANIVIGIVFISRILECVLVFSLLVQWALHLFFLDRLTVIVHNFLDWLRQNDIN